MAELIVEDVHDNAVEAMQLLPLVLLAVVVFTAVEGVRSASITSTTRAVGRGVRLVDLAGEVFEWVPDVLPL